MGKSQCRVVSFTLDVASIQREGLSNWKQLLSPKSRTGLEEVSSKGKSKSRTGNRSFIGCRSFESQIYATKKDLQHV